MSQSLQNSINSENNRKEEEVIEIIAALIGGLKLLEPFKPSILVSN